MMTRFDDETIAAKARELAEQVLLARMTPLIGKDYGGRLPVLRSRVAAIRAGNCDNLPEVLTAVAAMQWMREQTK